MSIWRPRRRRKNVRGADVPEDDVKAAFAVVDSQPGIAKAHQVVLACQFGQNGLQVKSIRWGRTGFEIFAFGFAVFGGYLIQRSSRSIVKNLFAAGVETRLRGVAVIGRGHLVAFDGSGGAVFGFEGINGVEKTVGSDLRFNPVAAGIQCIGELGLAGVKGADGYKKVMPDAERFSIGA